MTREIGEYKSLPVGSLVDVHPVFVRNIYVGYIYQSWGCLVISHSLDKAMSKICDTYALSQRHDNPKLLIEEIVHFIEDGGMWIFSEHKTREEALKNGV